jgi:hypothetical protein
MKRALIVNLHDPVAADPDVDDGDDEVLQRCAAGAFEDTRLVAALLQAAGFAVATADARPKAAAELQAVIARHAPPPPSAEEEPEVQAELCAASTYVVVVASMCATDDDDVSVAFPAGGATTPNGISAMVAAAAGSCASLLVCDLATTSTSMFRGHAGDDDGDAAAAPSCHHVLSCISFLCASTGESLCLIFAASLAADLGDGDKTVAAVLRDVQRRASQVMHFAGPAYSGRLDHAACVTLGARRVVLNVAAMASVTSTRTVAASKIANLHSSLRLVSHGVSGEPRTIVVVTVDDDGSCGIAPVVDGMAAVLASAGVTGDMAEATVAHDAIAGSTVSVPLTVAAASAVVELLVSAADPSVGAAAVLNLGVRVDMARALCAAELCILLARARLHNYRGHIDAAADVQWADAAAAVLPADAGPALPPAHVAALAVLQRTGRGCCARRTAVWHLCTWDDVRGTAALPLLRELRQLVSASSGDADDGVLRGCFHCAADLSALYVHSRPSAMPMLFQCLCLALVSLVQGLTPLTVTTVVEAFAPHIGPPDRARSSVATAAAWCGAAAFFVACSRMLMALSATLVGSALLDAYEQHLVLPLRRCPRRMLRGGAHARAAAAGADIALLARECPELISAAASAAVAVVVLFAMDAAMGAAFVFVIVAGNLGGRLHTIAAAGAAAAAVLAVATTASFSRPQLASYGVTPWLAVVYLAFGVSLSGLAVRGVTAARRMQRCAAMVRLARACQGRRIGVAPSLAQYGAVVADAKMARAAVPVTLKIATVAVLAIVFALIGAPMIIVSAPLTCTPGQATCELVSEDGRDAKLLAFVDFPGVGGAGRGCVSEAGTAAIWSACAMRSRVRPGYRHHVWFPSDLSAIRGVMSHNSTDVCVVTRYA